MSIDGDNIVRGRIRRWVAVHGKPSKNDVNQKKEQDLRLNEDAETKMVDSAPNGDV